MKFKAKDILKIVIFLFIAIFSFYLRFLNDYYLIALLLLVSSIALFIKVREDIYLIFMVIPIVYANYSISIGEFTVKNLQISLNSIRFYDYSKYLDVLLMLVLFTIFLFLFLKPKKNNKFFYRDNALIFYGLTLVTIIVNVFFFDRGTSDTYIVRSNSLHGYLYLIILFMSYYSGNKVFRKTIILVLVSFTAIQSLVFGGRQAIIPAVIVAFLMVFPKVLNYKNILTVTIVGILALTAIGQFRGTAGASLDFNTIVQLFSADYFVQDTSVYAFNSSVTHAVAYDSYSITERIISFIAFILSIFLGQDSSFTNLGNVTLIADRINNNLGGGIISSHFYFWLGWTGVLIAPLLVVSIINYLNKNESELSKLILVGVVSTSSTWYLYSPLQFFRIVYVFIPLMYFSFILINQELKKVKGVWV